jgi:hypothetical protein
MHMVLETYQRFRSITNYEGDEVDHEMEMVLMLGVMKMLMESLSLWRWFPQGGGLRAAGSVLSGVGEDFRSLSCLCISRENYDLTFFTIQSSS